MPDQVSWTNTPKEDHSTEANPMEASRNHRVFGIDLLKIMAMAMVVTLHLLFHGGIVEATPRNSPSGILLWLFRAENYCAVDLFVLASGWLLVCRPFRLERLLALGCQVYFTSIAIRLVALPFLHGNVHWASILSDYWFWNAYLAIALVSPILNEGVKRLTSTWPRESVWILVSIIALSFTVLPFRGVENGYGPLWLSVPYLVGATARLTLPVEWSGRARRRLLLAAGSLPAFGVAVRFLCWKSGLETPLLLHPFHYHSPLVLATALCWLLFFAGLRIRRIPAVLRLASAASFGVYLVHDNPVIRSALVEGRFACLGKQSPVVLFSGLILSVFAIYTAAMLLDGLRMLLFKKLGVAERIEALTARIRSAILR